MGGFRARDYLFYPAGIVRAHRAIGGGEGYNAEQRRAATQERLARALHHCIAQVPYYRQAYAPFRRRLDGMVADLDLSPLPYLTKTDIRRLGSALWADDRARLRPSAGHTSGTTGTPMEFLLGRDSHIAHFAGIWTMLNWCGYRFGQRFADLHSTPLPGNAPFDIDRRINCLRLCNYHLSRDTAAAFNAQLRRFRPVVLKGMPSGLYIFAKLLEDQGIAPYRPRVVLTCAETLHGHYRETLARVFGAKVFDFYNQNERACLFSTCEFGAYHIHEDYAFVELVDGDPARAEVVTTSLHNAAMPLVRYRTHDIAEVGDVEPCRCGRTHRTVRRILGRAQDVIVTPDGRFCNSFGFALEDLPGVRLVQFYQDDADAVEIRIVADDTFDHCSTPRLIETRVRRWIGDEIAVRFAFPDAITPGSNGKIQLIVSRPGREMTGRDGVATQEMATV